MDFPFVFLVSVLFYIGLLYIYYHGIIVHSGIAFKAHWWQPWQPDAIFHDNHHQYFHVNFGFNLSIWDKVCFNINRLKNWTFSFIIRLWLIFSLNFQLHGTYRQKDRVYGEHIFDSRGIALDEVTPDELARDLAERKSENPNAYRSNTNEYALNENDLKSK